MKTYQIVANVLVITSLVYGSFVFTLATGWLPCAAIFYYLWIPLYGIPAGAALVLECIGLVLYLVGCAFVLWARRSLGKMWGLSTSRNVRLRDDHQIIKADIRPSCET